ncbi:Wzz/FepE/Etk N-terminal domain-containing protein [Clostridium sp. A1-XYC3]|uniref:Wzz/FepE/Etk N-terminal domain-containing protein n=1 Tax=Clostridium tanneri TaxID=3037988 RepID=A0ABU4JXF5_9CLOT|nr:Wzz/FepE/Etk N-terminal domain-containing protein [Clostridium sp. A1-XYC3]MDW8802589.1 Wzz/FepE/Etk N-terminal domain-containing protein [Clostridium sp. A1-XYC3]
MNEEITLDLRDFFYIIRKRVKMIVGVTVACTLAAGILSFFVIKPTYEAKSTIIVGKPQGNEKNGNVQYNDVMMYQNLVKTYAEIAKSASVSERSAQKLGGSLTSEQLKKITTVTPQQGTQILAITATSKSPEEAVKIVGAVSSTFIEESKRVFPTGGDIQIMDKAKLPEEPIKPKKALNIAIAFFLGLMASVGLTFVLEYMDSTMKTEEDINKYLGLPVIGIIPKNMEQQN